MSEATPEKEIEVVTGVIEGVTQKKPDTWQVAVKPDGSQYTKNLWSKDAELVASLTTKLGQHGALVCSASCWTNQSGQQVRSLWINSEGPLVDGAVETVQTRATPGTAPRAYAPDLKDRMIVRQTALKAAAEIVAASPSAHPEYDAALEVMRAASRFERWVYRDIDPLPSDAAGRPPLSEQDDAIPF